MYTPFRYIDHPPPTPKFWGQFPGLTTFCVNRLPPGTFASMSNSPVIRANGSSRPQTPHKSSSFSRLVSAPSSPLARSRTSTLQTFSVAGNLDSDMTTSSSDDNLGEQEDTVGKSNLMSVAEGIVRDVSETEYPQKVGHCCCVGVNHGHGTWTESRCIPAIFLPKCSIPYKISNAPADSK